MDIFTQVQSSLEPYIKSRQEVDHIRRVLACHLNAQLEQNSGDPRAAALSLPNDSTMLKGSIGTVRGLRKEYLRSLRANIKARQEYDAVANAVGSLSDESLPQRSGSVEKDQGSATPLPDTDGYLSNFLALVKQRQRHERLRILQDYADKLSRKSTASSSYLDEAFESGSASLPQVLEDIIPLGEVGNQESAPIILKHLLNDLEKSVLQAQIRSKAGKKTLNLVKASLPRRQQDPSSPSSRKADALEALGKTRNELIAWVEQELSRAGDSDALDTEDGQSSSPDSARSIDDQLAHIRSQYDLYVRARQAFLSSTADQADPEAPTVLVSKDNDGEPETKEAPVQTMRVLSPYLEELMLVFNEQKAIIQQRSHLTVTLSKQHKEAVQLFDRLAEESHLLPSFPLPSSNSRTGGQNHPLSNEISGAELASTAHRARAWTYAAEASATAAMEAVLASTEEGALAIEEARQAILDLEKLLGGIGGNTDAEESDIWISEESGPEKGHSKERAGSVSHDIWASLDGQLGVIK